MPTPTGDCVSLALQNALSGRKGGGCDEEGSDLDSLISAGSKQALSTNVEYELAENQFANSLSAMKSKYLCFNLKPVPKKNGLSLGNSSFHNGNGVKNGTTNGVKNCSSMNGVKVNSDAVLPQPKFILFPPEEVVLGWKGKAPVGAGMQNMGNTCYLNSILQALFHVPALVNWLLDDTEHRKKCEQENGPSCGDCLTCALAKTLLASRSQDIMRPELITSKLRMICRFLSYGAEEDAHEFMRYLLENVEKGFLKRYPQKKLDPYSRETTPINQIFGGYMRTEVTCRTCGNVSTTFQHFQDLLLDIRKVTKVDDALDQYFSKEVLDGQNAYRCEKCKQVSQAIKKYSIERPPKVLCVQLKRFTGLGNKIMKSVEVKIHLSLQKYLNAASQYVSNVPLKYKLIAMVTHTGASAGGGHYTAIAETAPSSYHLFDDAAVRQIPLNSVLNTNAYILFFEMELSRTVNGQRETQTVSKAMASTVTSNGNSSSNGSAYSSVSLKNWDRVASPTQSSVQPHHPRLIVHPNKKGKLPLVEKVNALNRSEAEQVKSENKPGFIGPRLPTDTKATVEAASMPPLTNEVNGPKKRFVDGTVKVAEEKKTGKLPTSLVPYDDEDSSCSESSLSPSSGPCPEASRGLTAKATTPKDWQVTVSPSVRNSPKLLPVSSEGSTKANWNVTARPYPALRKSSNCSSDTEIDSKTSNSNTGDMALSRAASVDRTVGKDVEKTSSEVEGVLKLPLSPASLLNSGLKDKFRKRNDVENENDRIPNDSRDTWKHRSSFDSSHNRRTYKNEDSSNSHSSSWRNGGNSNWNGGPNRSQSSNRNNSSNQVSSNGMSVDRGMQNGVHSQSKNSSWSKDSSDTVSHLNKLSHTGFGNHVLTWNNDRSNLDRSAEEERRLARKRKSDEYNEEMDRGRTKKMRLQKEFQRFNPFNNHQNRYCSNQYPRSSYHHRQNGYNYRKRNNYYSPNVRNNQHKHAFFRKQF